MNTSSKVWLVTGSGSGLGRNIAEAVLAAEAGRATDPIAERYQGGTFCAAEYSAQTPAP